MRFTRVLKITGLVILIGLISQAVYLLPTFSDSNQSPTTNQASTQESVQGTTNQNNASFNTNSLYLLINAYRKDNNLSPLLVDPRLENSAQAKIADMFKQNYFRHQDKQNQPSWHLFTAAGYNYKQAGENLSFSHNTPWQVFQGWVNSPTHNQQLLSSNFEDMGLAADCTTVAELNDDNCVVVLHLGLR